MPNFAPLSKEEKEFLESRFDKMYTFVEQIGAGSFSNVYKGYMKKSKSEKKQVKNKENPTMAIKVLKPSNHPKRVQTEIEILELADGLGNISELLMYHMEPDGKLAQG